MKLMNGQVTHHAQYLRRRRGREKQKIKRACIYNSVERTGGSRQEEKEGGARPV